MPASVCLASLPSCSSLFCLSACQPACLVPVCRHAGLPARPAEHPPASQPAFVHAIIAVRPAKFARLQATKAGTPQRPAAKEAAPQAPDRTVICSCNKSAMFT